MGTFLMQDVLVGIQDDIAAPHVHEQIQLLQVVLYIG